MFTTVSKNTISTILIRFNVQTNLYIIYEKIYDFCSICNVSIFSYLNAAREGDNIEVEAITRKTGKKIAFLEVEVRNKDTSKVLATGRHTKYIGV